MQSLTPQEVAREAREALAKSPETSQEHFERLVRRGFINSRGEVTRLLGGDAEPEVTSAVAKSPNVQDNGHH